MDKALVLQDLVDLQNLLGINDIAEARMLGAVDRYHNRHIGIKNAHDVKRLFRSRDHFVFYRLYSPYPMTRIHRHFSDF